jgi:short-subunit dehydrogenase
MSLSNDAFRHRYGPWAVIAGASEGIGQAYAEQLAARGLHLITLARRSELLDADAARLRAAYGIEVCPVSLDLSAPDLAARFMAAIDGRDVGLLIYNACYSQIGPFIEVPLASHLSTLDVNCRGPLTLVQQLAPRLVERGRGGILLMSSMSGFQGSAMVASYAATKAFNTVLAEGLWYELRPHGIDVLGCIAGATLTPGFENNTPLGKRRKTLPMTPGDVAREGIAALPHGPVHITGRINRLVHALSLLLTRRAATRFFSSATEDIYAD